MAKTKIEWCDYTVNPVKGLCPVGCWYCYARRLYQRFHWQPELRLDLDAFQFLRQVKTPSRVFVGSTMELFGPWVPQAWMMDILSLCDSYRRAGHTFLFLTKQPQNLIQWSPFPDNVWAGVSATTYAMATTAFHYLFDIQVQVKFISFEPLLQDVADFIPAGLPCEWERLDWIIVGQCTPPTKKSQPEVKWILNIVKAADEWQIPVFLKDNLLPLLKVQGAQDNRFWRNLCDSHGFEPLHLLLRQEIPQFGSSVETVV